MTHTNSNSTFPYTKKHMIGSGGTAVVYLAEDHATGEEVAIKLIAKKVSAEQKFRARFNREIEMLKKISHPNILPVLNHGETADGQLFIAMPYISGGSVRDLLKDGAISWEETLNIMEQVCPALDEMHKMGFIHRDIKPHNILVGEDGTVMLSDFGISRPIEETQDSSVTHTLDIVGTPGFIAPEQAAKGELSAQTDIYQLGVTTFYMLTGERLFEGSTLEVIAKHIGEKPGLAEDLVDGLPRNIDAVLHMALAKDPKNRFRTAGDFLGALELLGDQNTVTFQHLPGFPLRAETSNSDSANAPAPAAYKAVIPPATGRGFSTEAQKTAESTITPSADATAAKKRGPFVRYAIAGFSIAALIIGGFFFIPDTPGGGNGGGNGNGNGRGNGNGGGQGNAADTAPTLAENNAPEGMLAVVNNPNNDAVTETDLPRPANDVEETQTQIAISVAFVADAQASAQSSPAADAQDNASAQTGTTDNDADDDGDGRNNGQNGNGNRGNDNEGQGNGGNNGNNGNGRGNGGRGGGN